MIYVSIFGLVMWLGAIANISFSLMALFMPDQLSRILGTEMPAQQLWLQDAALLLMFLSFTYFAAGSNPIRYRPIVVIGILARFVFAFLWFSLVLFCNYPNGVLIMGFADLFFGILQTVLYAKLPQSVTSTTLQ